MDEEIACLVLSVTATGVISLFWQQMLAQMIYVIFNIYQSPMTHLTTNSNILYLVHGYKKPINILSRQGNKNGSSWKNKRRGLQVNTGHTCLS